jgi:MYXO-CTERM domain-containing protein
MVIGQGISLALPQNLAVFAVDPTRSFSFQFAATPAAPAAVPELGTLALPGLGLAALASRRRQRKGATAA